MYSRAEIQPYLDDYAKVYGSRTDRFICPITLERCELHKVARGHIVNEAIGHSHNRKVPISENADSFYGTRVEESFVRFVNMAVMSAYEHVTAQREFQIRFVEGGRQFTAFRIRDEEVTEKQKHLPVVSVIIEGEPVWIGLKNARMDDPEISAGIFARPEITWSQHVMPAAWVATLLKMAHLTMFSMIRYKAVFNPSADVLRRFLSRYFDAQAEREETPDYFRQFQNSVKLVGIGNKFVPGSYKLTDIDTLRDNRVIFHKNAGRDFAVTLFYILHDKTFSVTIPQTTDLVDIGVATRLYDKLMDGDPTLTEQTYVYHYDGAIWNPIQRINMYYSPPEKS